MGSRFVSFLLDTHVWIWTQEQPDAMGPTSRALLESTTEALCVSAISSLEIARLRDLTLVTADERILAYRSVRTLDART